MDSMRSDWARSGHGPLLKGQEPGFWSRSGSLKPKFLTLTLTLSPNPNPNWPLVLARRVTEACLADRVRT